ncbi:hypothetical protein [uncultured Enterovirga sp.]|uniref:hypothetical protein n=1 Tax=uncultured Enterovirga sp. TaxID=2026352 RepID=UPI0035CC7026
MRFDPDRAAEDEQNGALQKQKIIALLHAASGAPNPTVFASQVEALKAAWAEIGDVGPATAALDLTYRDAIAWFYDAVNVGTARKPELGTPPAEHVERLKRWFGIR